MKPITILIAGICALLFLSACNTAPHYDVLIAGGRVFDSSGNESFIADVAIIDGRITAIGQLTGRSEMVLDGDGLYVTPGFIDIHNHSEFGVDTPVRNTVLSFLRQGVTAVVTGPDGGGEYKVSDLFARLNAHWGKAIGASRSR